MGWEAGMDEAGRGPVFGPLVVAGVAGDADRIAAMEVRDSKRLTPANRERIARLLEADSDIRIETRIITARDIDAEMAHDSLNTIELRRFQDSALALGAKRVVVDAADVDAARFGRAIAAVLPTGTTVISEHKADHHHASVAAASIIAKVTRDQALDELRRRLERKLPMPLGSGYPSDPKTRLFLATWWARFGEVPEGARRSWKTVRDLASPASARLDDF